MEQDENDIYDYEGENGKTGGICSWNDTQYTCVCFQQEDEYKL